jgi:biopolymer transport protein ExbD
MQQPPNSYPQNRQFLPPSPQLQQQPNYTQPQTYYPPQQQWQQPPSPQQQQWNPQQQPFPPQQYQQPPMPSPKKKTHKPMSFGVKIGVGAGLLLLVLLIILAAAAIDGNNNVNTANSQATQAAQDATGIAKDNQSIATVAVTQTALAVKKNQLLTQIPQASIQDQLLSIVQKSGAAYVGDATVNYDASAKYVHVFENFPVTGDTNTDVGRIKQDAFAIQKAIWQAHVSGVDAVQVIFNDDTSQQRLATCELEGTTAAKLKWASIASDQAWSEYDSSWLSPNL